MNTRQPHPRRLNPAHLVLLLLVAAGWFLHAPLHANPHVFHDCEQGPADQAEHNSSCPLCHFTGTGIPLPAPALTGPVPTPSSTAAAIPRRFDYAKAPAGRLTGPPRAPPVFA